MIVITDQQSSEVAQPGESALDFPAMTIAAQLSSVVEGRFFAAAPMGGEQKDAALQETPAQRIAVVGAIGNDAQGSLAGPSPLLRHRNIFERTFGQSYFPRRGRDQLDSQRNTFAVDHHHPLRAFAAFGFADAEAPFFA